MPRSTSTGMPPTPGLLAAILPFALLLLASAAAAQETATVRGIVVDSLTRAPLVDAFVALSEGRRAAVDLEGRFTLCGVAPGAARLTVQSFGYTAREEQIAVVPGDTAQLSMSLHRSGVVRIREGGGPLHPGMVVIVDGVRVFHSPSGCEEAPPGMPTMDWIDPDEIQSVEVMKPSQSVAAYGPGARHGGLLITTRRKAERPAP